MDLLKENKRNKICQLSTMPQLGGGEHILGAFSWNKK
jgi:hypothetical protein